MSDLLSELRAASMLVRQADIDRMTGLGVSIAWRADCETHPFGRAHVEDVGRGLYQPAPGIGRSHVIIPVLEEGVLVDLCAFRTTDPGNWKLRTGNGWALGLTEGVGGWLWFERVHLFDSPLDWLRGRGDGLCILDWDAPEVRDLDVLPEIICSSPLVARGLERAITRPIRRPKISIMEVADAA